MPEGANIKLSGAVSDINGKRSRSILEYLLTGKSIDSAKYDEMYEQKVIAHNLKATKEQIIDDHSMLIAIYYILKDGVVFKDLGAEYYNQFNKERKISVYLKKLKALGWETPDLTKYTEESVAKYNVALKAANDIMANEELSEDDQETVHQTVKALQAAYDALELKEGGDAGDNNNGGNNDNNGNTGNNSGADSGNANNGSTGNKATKTGDEVSVVLPTAGAGISLILILAAGVFLMRRKHR